ncbi:hypothetical protein LTS02_010533 [Friedmanniomyces endolithicus]|nr:hypothetical protein LTS02_010533 [Friedmanniomyces endolithicus]
MATITGSERDLARRLARLHAANTIRVPEELMKWFEEFKSKDEHLALLRLESPWLSELEKPDADLLLVREAFLKDGHTFMTLLETYLNTIKIREFLVQSGRYGAFRPQTFCVLFGVLLLACKKEGNFRRSQISVPELVVKTLRSRVHLLQAVTQRYDDEAQIVRNTGERQLWRRDVVRKLEVATTLSTDGIKGAMAELQARLDHLRDIRTDEMVFDLPVAEAAGDPWPLHDSRLWAMIGQNLRSLGQLVGAKSHRPGSKLEFKPIVEALREVISNEGIAVNILLVRLEKQHEQIRKQRQAITALQFRRLLESWKETQRWQEFWKEAVRQVYDAHSDSSIQNDQESTQAPTRQPSPFATLLGPDIDALNVAAGEKPAGKKPAGKKPAGKKPAGKKPAAGKQSAEDEAAEEKKSAAEEKAADRADAIRWLANDTPIGQHVKGLYSTLSELIHDYSDGQYEVDKLNFSPLDAKILTALIPSQGKLDSPRETDYWKDQFRRYIWEKPAGSEGAATAVIRDQDELERRVKIAWRAVQIRYAECLSSFTATTDVPEVQLVPDGGGNHALKVTYRPGAAAAHIDSDGFLKSTHLAALVESAGRVALALVPGDEKIGKSELTLRNFTTLESTASICVEAKLRKSSRVDMPPLQKWPVDVELKPDGGKLVVASGTFKAWRVPPPPKDPADRAKKGKSAEQVKSIERLEPEEEVQAEGEKQVEQER